MSTVLLEGQISLDGDVMGPVSRECDLEDEGALPSACLDNMLYRKCNPRFLPKVLTPASPRRGIGLFRPGTSERKTIKLCDSVHEVTGELSADTDATDVYVECRNNSGNRQIVNLGLLLTEATNVVSERFIKLLLQVLEGGE